MEQGEQGEREREKSNQVSVFLVVVVVFQKLINEMRAYIIISVRIVWHRTYILYEYSSTVFLIGAV